MRKYIFFFLLIPLFIYLLFSPGEAVRASAKGVDLWFHTVLPALLPFIILSGILVRSGILLPIFRKADKIFRIFPGLSGAGVYALLLGIFCGFPMGAKITAELLREGSVSFREAKLLLQVSNHVSPAFLLGYAASRLPDPGWAFPAAVLYYSAAAASFFLTRGFPAVHFATGKIRKKEASRSISPEELLDTSIMDGFLVILKLGGYIILFTVWSEMVRSMSGGFPVLAPCLRHLPGNILRNRNPAVRSASSRSADDTSAGRSVLSAEFPPPPRPPGMIRGSGLRLSLYLKGKLLQAGLAAAFTLLFFAVVLNHPRQRLYHPAPCGASWGRIRGSGLLLRRQLASVFIHDIVAALQRTDEAAVALALHPPGYCP